ncbi:MAG: PIN domain-containing protein [bacterium]|nr:PIN domain-containing protein [bacterium]
MTSAKDSHTNLPVQNIILDTNILQYSTSKGPKDQFIIYISELIERGFGLTISEITVYELLAGLSSEKEKQAIQTLEAFGRYKVEVDVFIGAAQLSTLYSMDKSVMDSGISTGDRIIAASAILTGSLILSSDVNDYPRPYFNEVEERLIYFKKKDRQHMISTYLLAPNIPVINQKFNERPK